MDFWESVHLDRPLVQDHGGSGRGEVFAGGEREVEREPSVLRGD